METPVLDRTPEMSPTQPPMDEFTRLMTAEFGETPATPPFDQIGETALGGITQAEIDAFAAWADEGDESGFSTSDQEFMAVNGITSRNMTAEELAIVEANERAAFAANAAMQAQAAERARRMIENTDEDEENEERQAA